ncbi:hypothetical protein PV328_004780 [Microctonus aethiopoides]|uniref:Protein kinase domain-containing protein n=1 Tax=Microctonus aethiopoides TaxID=144406 RepID=A0AA39FBI1_9HYME|nr:hypothetical protein PV328_004780 [Microctonus aethiopoides]
MIWIIRYGMRNLLWIWWICVVLPGTIGFPVTSSNFLGSTDTQLLSWEFKIRYLLGSIVIVAMVSAFLGCLCCRRERRAKGFQEFKDGSTAGSETMIERGLELEASRSLPLTRVQFEPLTVERFVPEMNKTSAGGKNKSSSFYNDREQNKDDDNLSSCREWFSPSLHVSRERLKYLREIGRGWFGKVVEGTQDIDANEDSPYKTRGMVVRILTEEASTSERAWFLGEALPYLKLRHRNLLELIGACLETDPYLLIFESCPTGDLKNFLRSNRSSMETLTKENVPLRMALDISVALDHMHRHGFAHMDLSARNCLVASDLSAKLGDYGVGVEKYPDDYYVVGDRALPIRWSAPESLVCTDTTIETRAITTQANIWSFGIVLWEIAMWGERPYDNLSDEQVIEMILKNKFEEHLHKTNLNNTSENILMAIESCWKVKSTERASLQEVTKILRGNKLADFDRRWEILKPNIKESMRSISLNELRENTDSDIGQMTDEKSFSSPQANFKLGPDQLSMKNSLLSGIDISADGGSGSETEEESWRGRVERGAYTEKVKQKSKSVADLMVLVHIDSDSEAEWSLTPQIAEKPMKKRLPVSGSVGNLNDSILEDKFDEALRKLRDSMNNPMKISRISPDTISETIIDKNSNAETQKLNTEYVNECTSTPKNASVTLSNAFVDVELWKNALEFELERKIPGFDLGSIDFEKYIDTSGKCDSISGPDLLATSTSAPDTPQSRGEDLSVDNDDFSNSDDIETERRRLPDGDDEEDRKHLSTPDDERSSDSGFRDKESCEEEENPMPCALSVVEPLSYGIFPTMPLSASTEEEQLKILLELDTILDAEDCDSIDEGLINKLLSPSKINIKIDEEDLDEEELKAQLKEVKNDTSSPPLVIINQETDSENQVVSVDNNKIVDNKNEENDESEVSFIQKDSEEFSEKIHDTEESMNIDTIIECNKEPENDNDDEDSSTMSLRSDNSYISFNLDEEFVAAIRNELREKLPRAQMSVVESQELRDEDEPSLNSNDIEGGKSWDEDEDTSECASGIVDIAIRYNIYGTPLSPILEERESAGTSESHGDTSIASKLSALSDDVLVVDTRTNQFVIVEGTANRNDDNGEISNDDITDEDSFGCGSNSVGSKFNDFKVRLMGSGAPLPSPEEESKWQAQFPIPIQLQDDLMSTSFSTEHDWDSQDEEEDEGRDENGGDDEDDENSSSSGEFVWKRYDDESNDEMHQNSKNNSTSQLKHVDKEGKIDEEEPAEEEEEEEEDDEEEEFTPSAWDATLAPHRSALRSPEKTYKAGDQKKNVWFKKQRYHCVYEYPKETPVSDCQAQPTTTWEPTTYADWEEMMDQPRVDTYPIDYDDSTQNNEEFFVSSGNRPFQFQVGDGKYVSQFFPGAVDPIQTTHNNPNQIFQRSRTPQDSSSSDQTDYPIQQQQQQMQLGELRHTRDRLRLNLPIKQLSSDATTSSVINNNDEIDNSERDNGMSDSSQDLKTEKRENSSESTFSKDEPSIISMIRSPINSSLENISRDELSSPTNGETELEISELDNSFKDECVVKSSRRPLVILSDDNQIEKISNKLNNDEKFEGILLDVGTSEMEIKQVQGMDVETLENKNKTLLKDEISINASISDCVIETSQIEEVDDTTKSVREST